MRVVWLVLVTGVLGLLLLRKIPSKYHQPCSDLLWNATDLEFEDFDNETGIQTGELIVPNIVHFLRMGPAMKEFNFIDVMCVLAAFKNQQPDMMFFHTDHSNFTGKYWEKLLRIEGFADRVVLVPTVLPIEIFDQPLSYSYHLYHAGDLLRIRLLMRYGGIFLDNDSYLVQSLDPYRKYEFALSWDEGSYLGTQVLVAHKDARFLRLWLESYREYHPDLWYYNAGERPTKKVLWARPELVHRVKLLFGTHWLIDLLYETTWPAWRQQYAIHLLIRHYWSTERKVQVDGESLLLPKQFTEENILKYPITMKQMAEDVLPLL